MSYRIEHPIETAISDHDREKCRELINKVFPEGQSILRKDCPLISEQNCSRELCGADKKLFMLFESASQQLIGTVLLTLGQGIQVLPCIQYLAVHSNFRNLGHGSRLLQHAENWAIRCGKKAIALSVVYHPKFPEETDRLTQLYGKRGYLEQPHLERIPEDKVLFGFAPEYQKGVRVKWYRKSLVSVA